MDEFQTKITKEELFNLIQKAVYTRFSEQHEILEHAKVSLNNILAIRYKTDWLLLDIKKIIEEKI